MALTLLAGCTGGGQGGDTPATDGGPLGDGGDRIDAEARADAGPPMCAALPDWVVTAVEAPAPCIGRVPTPGERVLAADGRLRLAELNLPIVGGDCDVPAYGGCALDADAGDRHAVRGTLDVAGGRLVLEGERVEAYRADDCAPVTLSLAPAPTGCQPGGRFEVSTPPQLVAGTCDLSWPAGTVTLAVGPDDTGEVEWGDDGRRLAIVAVDRERCAVTADGGLLLFNGSVRTISLTAVVDGDRVELTIEDGLDETSDFGEDCVDARFAAEGTRLGPDGPALDATCDALPFVCGDGVCAEDAGEQCGVCPEDCGCGDALCMRYSEPSDAPEAPPRYTCAAACDGACPADQRCVYSSEFEGAFFGDDRSQRVCLDARGDTPWGGPCDDSRGCADGLICAGGQCFRRCIDVDRATCDRCEALPNGVEICHGECSAEVTDQCGAGACASQTLNRWCSTRDRESYFCLPEFFSYSCAPEAPSFGEPCGPAPYNVCGVDLGCVEERCARDGTRFDCELARCTRRCETDDDCAEPLGVCTSLEAPGRPPSRWCTGA